MDIARYSDYYPNYFVIKDTIDVQDINQGAVGDCYLLCAISALAEYPERIKRILLQRKKSPYHAYCVSLCIAGEFKEFYLDDQYYCNELHQHLKTKPPIFSHNNGEEIWVSLIEKAYAKAYGSYFDLNLGYMENSFFDLTGAPSEGIGLNHWIWNGNKKTIEELSHAESEALFKRIAKYDKQGFSMAAQTPGAGESQLGNGLVSGHE